MRSQFDDHGGGPDLGQVMNQVGTMFRSNLRKFGPLAAGLLVALVAWYGAFKVGPGEEGVVRTLGKHTATKGPGLHFAVPLVQQKDIVNVTQVRRAQIGFRDDRRILDEGLMLTGDANIVEAHMIVQYRVADSPKYLFRVNEPERTLQSAAEVALRATVGRTTIDDVLTTGREAVQVETAKMLQQLLDDYQSGLTIAEVKLQVVDPPEQVKEAFHDVVRAKEEREKLINEARSYEADIIPRARGEREQVERAAEAYKEQRVLRAKGDAARFEAQWAEYQKAPRVTRERLYYETLERILGRIEQKVLIDASISGSTLPFLPLGGARGPISPALQQGRK